MKFVIPGLIFFGFILADAACPGPATSTEDIVYSARYYNPGAKPSDYKIWRTDASGSRRVQVTSGNADDYSPIWLADGKTILFVRERKNTRTLCTVGEHGGRVTELTTLAKSYVFLESVAPDRRKVVYLVNDSGYKLVLFDLTTRRLHTLGTGTVAAWSPDCTRLYVSPGSEPNVPAQILDLATGNRIPLMNDLGKGAWLNDDTLVTDLFFRDLGQHGRLFVFRADGTQKRDVPLPFAWEDQEDELCPFADNISAVPGDPDHLLYGRHRGYGAQSDGQRFYLVNLKGDQPVAVADGRALAWSPDHRFFVTGDDRNLAALDRKRCVWVSPLSVVTLASGEVHRIVQGLVSVGGFDWRPAAQNMRKRVQRREVGQKQWSIEARRAQGRTSR